MNVKQEISGLKESTGWLWLIVIVVSVVSCTNSSRLRKLEAQNPIPTKQAPTKPRPGALLLPTAPHVPAVKSDGADQVAAATAALTSGGVVAAAGQASFS
ncbi:MAG: hypothetical protein AB7I57_22860 [Pirellulales bacterium]